MKRGHSIDDILRPLSVQPTQAYLTNLLQVADVIQWCLEQIGCRVTLFQTSFSISDEYLRRLFVMRKSYPIGEIYLVLDNKATEKTMRIRQFLSQTIEHVFLAENHSKIILILPDDVQRPSVAIITSQNLTRGNRFESAIVTTDSSVFRLLYDRMQDIIQNKSHSLTFQ